MHTELPKAADLSQRVFSVSGEADFEALALHVFRFQHQHNRVYQEYCNAINIHPAAVTKLAHIPFLPIAFFKSHNVQCDNSSMPSLVFESSRTTGMQPSRHLVPDKGLYEQSFRLAFEQVYGSISKYCILGLLPSYLERQHSSLVYMVNDLIAESGHSKSGFYLYDFKALAYTLTELERAKQPTLLFGVTYALLDFADAFPMPLQYTTIIETGGMKGRKQELIREEVHRHLKKLFGVAQIHSEYGMTELLSQAYAKADGRFYTPNWMRVLLREEDDPLALTDNRTGGINIIDLANVYSCAFIATEDVGRMHADGSFEVLGRLDHAEVRGCSLLAV